MEDIHVKWGSYTYKSGGRRRVNLGDVETSVKSAIMALVTLWKLGILWAAEIPWGISYLHKIPRQNKL